MPKTPRFTDGRRLTNMTVLLVTDFSKQHVGILEGTTDTSRK